MNSPTDAAFFLSRSSGYEESLRAYRTVVNLDDDHKIILIMNTPHFASQVESYIPKSNKPIRSPIAGRFSGT